MTETSPVSTISAREDPLERRVTTVGTVAAAPGNLHQRCGDADGVALAAKTANFVRAATA